MNTPKNPAFTELPLSMGQEAPAPNGWQLTGSMRMNAALAEAAKDSPLIAAKKASVTAQSEAKKTALGSPEGAAKAASALINENVMGQDEQLRDMVALDPISYVAKYGFEAGREQYEMAKAVSDLQERKTLERTNTEAVGDTALGLGVGGVNLVGGALAFGAAGVDAALGTNISPYASLAQQWAGNSLKEFQSEALQERRKVHQIEAQLAGEDTEKAYQEALARGDSTALSWLKKQGNTVADVISNYAEDPMMLGDLAAEGAGSMVPVAAGAKLASMAGVAASKSVPILTAVSESGAAVAQTQQQIMAMDEKELIKESEPYIKLRKEGMSHEEARLSVATDAGIMAGVLAVPLAAAAGRIGTRFEANPLSVADGGLKGIGSTVLKETGEEFIQEANSQFTSNVALDQSAQIETSWDKGVVEAGTTGAIGGAMVAGGLQAPGLVAEVAKSTAKAVTGSVGKAIDSRLSAAETEADKAAGVDIGSRVQAATTLLEGAATVAPTPSPVSVPEAAREAATEADSVSPIAAPEAEAQSMISEQIIKAARLDEADQVLYAKEFEVLGKKKAENPSAEITRSDVIFASEALVTNKKAPIEDRMAAALTSLTLLDDMRKLGSDEVMQAVESLPEGDTLRETHSNVLAASQKILGSRALIAAEQMISEMTPEIAVSMIPVSKLETGTQEEKDQIIQMVGIIARINPTAVGLKPVEQALNQIKTRTKGTNKAVEDKMVRLEQDLSFAQESIQLFEELDAERASVQAAYDDAVIDSPKGLESWKSFDTVRNEIRTASNQTNGLPSLQQHYQSVAKALAAGNMKQAAIAVAKIENFATHMTNKVKAYNEHAEKGLSPKERVKFEAYGPAGWFTDEKGVYTAPNSPRSKAAVQEAHADMKAATRLYNLMAGRLERAGGPKQKRLKAPKLNEKMAKAKEPKAPKKQTKVVDNVEKTIDEQPTVVEPTSVTEEVPAVLPTESTRSGGREQGSSGLPSVGGADLSEGSTRTQEAVQSTGVLGEPGQSAGRGNTDDAPDSDGSTEPSGPLTNEKSVTAVKAWMDSLKDVLMVGRKGVNYFLTAFKPRSSDSSTLLRSGDPAAFLMENINALVTTENTLEFELNETEQAALIDMVQSEMPTFMARMNELLNEAAFVKTGKQGLEGEGKNLFDRLKESNEPLPKNSVDPLLFSDLVVANFASTNTKGDRLFFNENVLAATFMAAMEWVIQNQSKRANNLDDLEVNKMLGLPRSTTGGDRKALKEMAMYGTMIQPAMDQIAQKIQVLLGVQDNREVSVEQTQGMMKALAANALEYLSHPDVGILDVVTKDIEVPVSEKFTKGVMTQSAVRVSENGKKLAMVKDMTDLREPFTKIFTNVKEKDRYIGKPPGKVTENQLRNPLSRVTKESEKVLNRLNNTAYRVNLSMLDTIDAMGKEAWLEVMGYRDLSEADFEGMNVNTALSIKGVNNGLLSGYEETMGYVSEARRLMGDGSLEEAKIFFNHAVSSVGRIQQEGAITPQGDKTAREVISSTISTIDLSNEDQVNVLWLALAQSVGLKVEKQPHAPVTLSTGVRLASIREDAEKFFSSNGAMGPAVAMMKGHIQGEQPLDGKAFVAAFQGQDVTQKMVHAVRVAAELELALEKGETSFTTALALEADGKTDGPVNAIIHMGTGGYSDTKRMRDGGFSAADVERMAKGGLFFTGRTMALNDFYVEAFEKDQATGLSTKLGEDLYHIGARRFSEKLDSMMRSSKETSLDSFPEYRVLSRLLDGFDLAAGVERNLIKNPLTVFLYGSSVKGIAGKMVGEVTNNFYQIVTDAMAAKEAGQIKRLLDHPGFGPEGKLVQDLGSMLGVNPKIEGQIAHRLVTDPTNFSFRSGEIERLLSVVEESFAQPMADAIDEATGGLQQNMLLVQAASQVQALIFTDKLNAALKRAQEAKGELLSQDEMEKLFASMMRIAPIYSTGGEAFQIAAMTRKNESKKVISKSLGKKLQSTASLVSAKEASVKASPFLTIGTGDGQMIMNIYLNGDGMLEASLPVFDGVELGVANAAAASAQINEAVFEGWTGQNTYKAVTDGLSQLYATLEEGALANLSAETQKELGKVMGQIRPKKNDRRDTRNIKVADLVAIMRGLEERATVSQARKNAIRRMATQTDHMAGAKQPHGRDGVTLPNDDPTDFESITEQLNILYVEELDKLSKQSANAAVEKGKRNKEEYHEPESEIFKKAVKAAPGQDVEGFPGIRLVKGKDLYRVLKGMSADQASVFKDLLRSNPKVKEASYYFGPAEELDRLKSENFGKVIKQEPIGMGQAYPDNGLVFIAHMAPETLLHEMLHVATKGRLEGYYNDKDGAPENVRIAVKNLENLVKEVMTLTLEDKALNHLQDRLESLVDNPAARVGELISYALTNQNLIRVGKEKTSYGPMFNVIRKGLHWFKRMLGIKSDPGNTVFSNIRFNAEVLLRDIKEPMPKTSLARAEEATEVESALNQIYGNDERLTRIERVFGERLKSFVDASKAAQDPQTDPTGSLFTDRVAKMIQGGGALIGSARANGFALDARQATAAKTVFTAVSSGMSLDPAMTRQIGRIYDQFMGDVTAAKLLAAQGNTAPSHNDLVMASSMITFLGTNDGVVSGATSKADTLAVFVALAAVDPMLRNSLDKLVLPKMKELEWNSADGWVRSIGSVLVDLIMRLSFTRPNQSISVRRKLDELTLRLGSIQEENKALVWNRMAQTQVERANSFASSGLDKGSRKLNEWIDKAQNKVGNDKTKGLTWAAKLVVGLGSKEVSEANGEALNRMMNEASGWEGVRALLRDVRGATGSTFDFAKMINVVKYTGDAVRQRYRVAIPEVLGKKFKSKLKAETWSAMHKGFGETDIMSLGMVEALDVIKDPSSVDSRIAKESKELAKLAGKFAPKMEAKAKALAIFMVRKEVTSRMLVRNAAAIARMGGENRSPSAKKAIEAIQGADLERAISRLVSLMAYKELDQNTKGALKALADSEPEGVESVIATLRATRQSEIQQNTTEVGKANGWKGHVPVVTEEGASVVVLEDVLEGAKALSMGYVRVGNYVGDVHEVPGVRRGYYRSDVGGKAAFKQGIAKAVHQRYLGADTNSGLSVEGYTNGAIFAEEAQFITKSILSNSRSIDGLAPGEYLLPVLDRNYEVVGYERPLSAKHYNSIQKDDHLGRMIGVWMGRIVEEQQALETNRELLKLLKDKWDKAPVTSRDKTFVNVADSKDPVIRDAWSTLGWNIKDDAEEIFGQKNFVPVSKEMVDDAIGFRAVSVTDHWTGISRLSERNQDRVRGIATLMMGQHAYRRLSKLETGVQDAVSFAKTNIVVRAVVVAYENIVSNVFHLSVLGVSLPDIVSVGRRKFIETTQFVENSNKIRELEVELARLVNKPAEKARTEGRIAALKQANERLSIAPLIAAGEFSTVSENLTEADVAIRGGRWADYLEKATDKLPGWTPALAKNLLITKDTALFQGLNRMIQYGDFVAKAILHEHMTVTEKKSEEEAMNTILEEFVQYNRLAGRGRDNLESWGLLWFYNYKLRINKIAVRAFRDKPLSALMMNAWAPGAGIDTAYSGSLPGAMLDGRLGYSIGPEMGINSIFMNPWYNLTR